MSQLPVPRKLGHRVPSQAHRTRAHDSNVLGAHTGEMDYSSNVVLFEDSVECSLVADVDLVKALHIFFCNLLHTPQALDVPVRA